MLPPNAKNSCLDFYLREGGHYGSRRTLFAFGSSMRTPVLLPYRKSERNAYRTTPFQTIRPVRPAPSEAPSPSSQRHLARHRVGKAHSASPASRDGCTYTPVAVARPSAAPIMPEYRAYAVGDDGHFNGFEPLVCNNDDEAIAKAKIFAARHGVELWSGPRLVIAIPKRVTAVTHEVRDGRLVPKPT
jgi:hypothetical protein